MDEQLHLEVHQLAGTLDDPREAELVVALLEIASQTEATEQADEDYTPFVYPH